MKTILVRVSSALPIGQDIRLVTLAAVDGSPLPAYPPGSHIDLHLDSGLIRQYSLCGLHNDVSSYAVAVKLEPESRGGSKWVHEKLGCGIRAAYFGTSQQWSFRWRPKRDTASSLRAALASRR